MKVVKPKKEVKPKVAKPRVSAKKVVKVAKVAKVAKKPRKYNIRGGTIEEELNLKPSSPPLSASVSGSTSRRRILQILPDNLLLEKERETRINLREALRKEAERVRQEAEREAVEAKARRIARETVEKEGLRIAVEEAVRRSNNRRVNSRLSSFANLSYEEKLKIFAKNYQKLKAEEEMSGETLTRERDYYSKLHKRQNEVLNGLRSS